MSASASSSSPGLPVLAELDSLIDALVAVDVTAVSAAELGIEIRGLTRAIAQLEAQLSRRIDRFDACGGAAADREAGAASTKSWLQARLRMSGGDAATQVRTARALRAPTGHRGRVHER